MDNKPVWAHKTFASFFKNSPRKAYEYRRDALGNEIPDEYKTEEEKGISIKEITEEIKTESVETLVSDGQVSFTKEELQEKLRTAGVKFSHLAGEESLLKKCLEANLI